jgi:hypothetical protein
MERKMRGVWEEIEGEGEEEWGEGGVLPTDQV